jgi:hypothetical protein
MGRGLGSASAVQARQNPALDLALLELEQVKEKQAELAKEVRDKSEAAIKLTLQEIMRAHPKLKQFVWTQRTAHEYNDNTWDDNTYIEPNFTEFADQSWGYDWGEAMYEGEDQEVYDLEGKLSQFVNQWDHDLMFDLFGSENAIFVTRSGVEIKHLSDAPESVPVDF